MAADWPTSPAAGDLYPTSISPGQPQWQFNSESGWQRVVNAGQTVSVFVAVGPFVDVLAALPTTFGMGQWTQIVYL